jgi:hypothetical protein
MPWWMADIGRITLVRCHVLRPPFVPRGCDGQPLFRAIRFLRFQRLHLPGQLLLFRLHATLDLLDVFGRRQLLGDDAAIAE